MSFIQSLKCFCGFHKGSIEVETQNGGYFVCEYCNYTEYIQKPKHKRIPEIGTRKYSKFFRTEIELIQYVNDNHWYFRIVGEDRTARHRAQTQWSKM